MAQKRSNKNVHVPIHQLSESAISLPNNSSKPPISPRYYQESSEHAMVVQTTLFGGHYKRRSSFACRRIRADTQKLVSQERKQAFESQQDTTTLIETLKCPEDRLCFRTYCIQCAAEESLDFISAVEEFKQLPESERFFFAKTILDRFIGDNASNPVNLDAFISRSLKSMADKVPINMFDEGVESIISMMEVDIYSRFKKTEMFSNLIRNHWSYAVTEIRSSEQSYCFMFREWIDFFIKPFEENKALEIPRNVILIIQSNIFNMYNFHSSKLLPEFNSSDNPCQVLLDHFTELSQLYTEYIQSYKGVLDIFSAFHSHKKFKKFLHKFRTKYLGGKDPVSYMIHPLQRLAEYLTMIKKLINSTDGEYLHFHEHQIVKIVSDKLFSFIASISIQKIICLGWMSQVLAVQHKLNGLDEPIMNESRQLIINKKLPVIAPSKIFGGNKLFSRVIYLFNDSLIWSSIEDEVKGRLFFSQVQMLTGTTPNVEYKEEKETEPVILYPVSLDFFSKDNNHSQEGILRLCFTDQDGFDEWNTLLNGIFEELSSNNTIIRGPLAEKFMELTLNEDDDDQVTLDEGFL